MVFLIGFGTVHKLYGIFCFSLLYLYMYIFQKQNGGVVMVNFYDKYINCPPNVTPNATLSQVAGNYISSVVAREHFDSLNSYSSHYDCSILICEFVGSVFPIYLWSHGLESDLHLQKL